MLPDEKFEPRCVTAASLLPAAQVVRLQRLQPVAHGLARVVDRRGDDHRPFARAMVNLHDPDAKAPAEMWLEPSAEY
jgi:hypothetical protein